MTLYILYFGLPAMIFWLVILVLSINANKAKPVFEAETNDRDLFSTATYNDNNRSIGSCRYPELKRNR